MPKTTKKQEEPKKEVITLTEDSKKEINLLSDNLLQLLGTQASSVISEDKENDSVNVDVTANDESGLLIGNRGKTLSALETITSLIVRKKLGGWKRVLVNISDWREKEEGRLKDLALKVADRAKTTGESQPLYNLTASQRRIIHMTLSENPDVKTESSGEGKDRYLIVSPK